MKQLFVVGLALVFSSAAMAGSVSLQNLDHDSYKLLLSDSDSCFSGTHTSIGGNTSSHVDAKKFICLHEKKPAFPLVEGKKYIIKDGKVAEKK